MRPVRDAICERQDKRKEQVDANGRGCIESLKCGNEVVLNAKRLLTNVILAVIMKRLRRHFINPLTVVHKTGIAYKLNLLRKFSKHSVFNAGLWMPYRDSSPVRLVAFALPWVAVPHFLHPRQDIELYLYERRFFCS